MRYPVVLWSQDPISDREREKIARKAKEFRTEVQGRLPLPFKNAHGQVVGQLVAATVIELHHTIAVVGDVECPDPQPPPTVAYT